MKFNKASFKSSVFATLITIALFGVLPEGAWQNPKDATQGSPRYEKILQADGPYQPPQLPGQPPKAIA